MMDDRHLILGTNARHRHDLPAVEGISAWQKEVRCGMVEDEYRQALYEKKIKRTDGINQFSRINTNQAVDLRHLSRGKG